MIHRHSAKFLVVALLVGLTASVAADPLPKASGWPVGKQLAKPALPLSAVDLLTMEPVDAGALLAEDAAAAGPGVPLRFAKPIPVQVEPSTHGTWEALPGDGVLWRLRVRSPGALSLNLAFTRYAMPADGRLIFYAVSDGKAVTELIQGPYSDLHNTHGQLWTPIVLGDEAVIEVTLPAARVSDLKLELTAVNHGYRPFGPGPDKSGSCNVDVACPEGNAWEPQIRSVAAIGVGGTIFCTGFMINNTAQDLRPLFMTADHCGFGTSRPASSLVAYWNYNNPTCRPPGSVESGTPYFGSLDQNQTGATLLGRSATSDYTLMELDASPPADYNVYWAGWDVRSIEATNTIAVHHPRGHAKRISFDDDPTTTTTYLQTSVPGDGTHIRVADWDLGTTEGGSSGSPLFNQVGRVIGQLHGGFAACGNDSADWYGRMSRSWELGLSAFLDPGNTGLEVLDGNAPSLLAPSNLQAMTQSASAVQLTWQDNSDNEDEFRIEVQRRPAVTGLGGSDDWALRPLGASKPGAELKSREAEGSRDKDCVLMTMTCDTTVTGVLDGTDCELDDMTRIDFWEFEGTGGQTVTINMTSDDFDTFLFLLDPTPATVAFNDDADGTTNSRIVHTLDATGTWTIGANGFASTDLGDYTVSLDCSGDPPSPPEAPSNLTAIANSASEITLTWEDNSNNEQEFRIEVSSGGSPFQDVGAVAANSTTVDVINLSPEQTYSFRVRARNGAGDSSYSNEASATTFGEFVDVASAAANSTGAIIAGLNPGTTYGFRVRARSGAENSTYSNVAVATTLPGTTPDSDGDGVPDDQDVCPGFDDRLDADGDGVPDGCDLCEGSNDNIDVDNDGIPDGCDPCVAGPNAACLLGDRFRVVGTMQDFSMPPQTFDVRVMDFASGRAESNQAVFWESFAPGNFEIGVKMVNGCTFPEGNPLRNYWVFFGGLTNAETDIRVEDMVTGQTVDWNNPTGVFPQTIGDTSAFPCTDGTPTNPCVRDANTACLLGNRFRVSGSMRDFSDPPVNFDTVVMDFPTGRAESNQAVFFESFAPGNFEVGVKMVNGCTFPEGHPLRFFWVFYGGLTNAETRIEVTQLSTGMVDVWQNPVGVFPISEGRTSAFPATTLNG